MGLVSLPEHVPHTGARPLFHWRRSFDIQQYLDPGPSGLVAQAGTHWTGVFALGRSYEPDHRKGAGLETVLDAEKGRPCSDLAVAQNGLSRPALPGHGREPSAQGLEPPRRNVCTLFR